MAAAQQFVAHGVTEQRLIHGVTGVAHHHGLALLGDLAIHHAGVVSGPCPAPATRLHLHRHAVVGDFQEALCALEQLTAEVGDQAEGCTVAHARLAVESVAKFHATWWESPRLKEIGEWMPAINAPVQQVAAGAYAQAWQPFLDMFGAGLSPEVRSAPRRPR